MRKQIHVLCIFVLLSSCIASPVSAQIVEYFSKAAFLAALPSPEIIDFDSLPANSNLTGLEYVTSGIVITQLDGRENNVISSPPICPEGASILLSTTPNGISSSYASISKPG